MSAERTVTAEELHTPTNTPSDVRSHLAPGVSLTDAQAFQVGVIIDIFQGKGTQSKLNDAFTEDAVYEDKFADCRNRDEIAGQLVNLPMVLSETNTESYTVLSVTPSTTTTGSRQDVPADEIAIDFNHTFTFKAPLPKAAKSITIHTTLLIWSSEKEGKIVRLQDRPKDDISDNSFLSAIRQLNAAGVPKVIPNPKDEKADAEKVMAHQR